MRINTYFLRRLHLLYQSRKVDTKTSSYMEAFAALGYKPEQVTKILLTHWHSDRSGEMGSFPQAKIYVNADEAGADEFKGLANLTPVTFTDGADYSFPESQKTAEGVTCIKAKGRTNGNSIVIVEKDGLFHSLFGILYPDIPAMSLLGRK